MIRGALEVFFVLVLLSLAISPGAAAQTSDPCLVPPITWWFLTPIPPGWWPIPGSSGWFFYLITTNKAAPGCAPPPECPCSTSPGAPAPPKAGSPVYLATGDVYVEQIDVSLPGLSGGLNLRRTWNSLWPYIETQHSVGIFGPHWRSTYEESVFVGSDNYLKYARGDGGFWSFGLSPAGTWVVAAPAGAAATLSQAGNYWQISFGNGERRLFDYTTGLLSSIVDRNGNTTTLSYDSSNRLGTVTSAASQHLYLNYGTGSSNYLVTSVTSDFGVSLSYAYDAQGRLIQVTRPDTTTVSFTYNTQSQITAVTDNEGKVLESHTYDASGRGLTSSQANGVNAVSIAYPQ